MRIGHKKQAANVLTLGNRQEYAEANSENQYYNRKYL